MPPLLPTIPVIALSAGAPAEHNSAVRIAIGQHGRDHDGVEFARDVQALAFRRASETERPAERSIGSGRDCRVAAARGRVMLTRLSGGRIIDPANGSERVGDLFIDDERIVAEPQGRSRRSDLRCFRQNRHGRRHRHPFAYCRRQREYRASAPAGNASGPCAAALRSAAFDGALVHVRDRLSLRQDGVHHRGRARRVAASRSARASRAGRHADHRQGGAGGARQRRFPALDAARGRERKRRRRLCRGDAHRHARARHQMHQCGRRDRVQV